MIDERDLFERAAARFDPPTDAFERFTDRRERRQRTRRVAAGVVSALVVLLMAAAVLWSLSKTEEDIPAPPPDVFAPVHGWIALGGTDRITAVDPLDPTRTKVLSADGGVPLTWSQDGSKLLVLRGSDLVVLASDGTETAVTDLKKNDFVGGGSFTPDGTAVVYEDAWSIYEVPVTGGDPTVIAKGNPDNRRGYVLPFFRGGQVSSTGVLAYIPIHQPEEHDGIWLMNLDGSGPHELTRTDEFADVFGDVGLESIDPEAWSPDGSRLLVMAVSNKLPNGGVKAAAFVINADGSGLRRVTPDGVNLWSATFSPDGQWITGVGDGLVMVSLDGSRVRRIAKSDALDGTPGLNSAWNPVSASS